MAKSTAKVLVVLLAVVAFLIYTCWPSSPSSPAARSDTVSSSTAQRNEQQPRSDVTGDTQGNLAFTPPDIRWVGVDCFEASRLPNRSEIYQRAMLRRQTLQQALLLRQQQQRAAASSAKKSNSSDNSTMSGGDGLSASSSSLRPSLHHYLRLPANIPANVEVSDGVLEQQLLSMHHLGACAMWRRGRWALFDADTGKRKNAVGLSRAILRRLHHGTMEGLLLRTGNSTRSGSRKDRLREVLSSCALEQQTPCRVLGLHGLPLVAALVSANSAGSLENGDDPTASETQHPSWIVMAGDSMMRQMFLRLVSMIRSPYPAASSWSTRRRGTGASHREKANNNERDRLGIVEHYFHHSASYVVTTEGDSLALGVSSCGEGMEMHQGAISSAAAASASSASDANQQARGGGRAVVLLRICFQWDPSQHLTQDTLNRIKSKKPNIVLITPSYQWIQKTGKDRNPADVLTQLKWYEPLILSTPPRHEVENDSTRKMKRASWILFTLPGVLWPWAFGEGGMNSNLTARNVLIRDWVKGMKERIVESSSLSRDNNALPHLALIDLERLPALYKHRCDQVHFMCNFVPMLPMRLDHVKSHCQRCRDPSNFNIVSAVVTELLLVR